jgi:hypothetical protein
VDRNEQPAPNEHYYVLVWASQRIPKSPAHTHTFATVIHTAEQGPGNVKVLGSHTISWLPATLDIKTLALRPEPGVNLTLQESLDWVQKDGQHVFLWGPYECRASVYRRFLIQKEFMETSGIGYQCVDNIGEAARLGNGCNCIHSITDADPEFGRENYPLIWFGDSASEHLALRLRKLGSIINPEIEHDEILAALGLCEYQIRRRHFDDHLIDFARLQPAEVLFGRLRGETRQAPPYATPPFPPPGNRGH